jgi:hypothetical protein
MRRWPYGGENGSWGIKAVVLDRRVFRLVLFGWGWPRLSGVGVAWRHGTRSVSQVGPCSWPCLWRVNTGQPQRRLLTL